jgi:DNA end-binding protein Ku
MVDVMGSTDRGALGQFVLRTKEYLVLIRVRDGRLSLTTMLFHDEVRPTDGIETGAEQPAKEQVDQTVALIEELSVDWDPGRYEDRFRQRLLEVIDRKKKGERVTVPEQQPPPAAVPDLMAALRRSMENLERKPTPTPQGDAGDTRPGAAVDELESLSRDELYERAQRADIPGRSTMNKRQLVKALSS